MTEEGKRGAETETNFLFSFFDSILDQEKQGSLSTKRPRREDVSASAASAGEQSSSFGGNLSNGLDLANNTNMEACFKAFDRDE